MHSSGVRLWDLASGRELIRLQSSPCLSLAFTPDGHALLMSGVGGFQRWPIRPDPAAPDGLVIGPPHTLNLPLTPAAFQLASDGRTAAVVSEKSQVVVLIDMKTEKVGPFLLDNPLASTVALSPDGRWAASGGWHAPATRIWDAHTGRMVKELTLGEQTGVYFSPDSRWFITSRFDEYCFWDVETRQPGLRIPREQEPYPGPVAFTPDGEQMAVELTPGVISLMDWKAGRTLARLEDPTHDRASALCFSPDGAQLTIIAPYEKALHVWDLRRIRDHLEEMHLEGDWLAYPPAPPPAPALRIRQDAPGIAGPRPVAAPPPVVVLPPLNPKHREATPRQIQDWIHQLGGDDAKASAEAAAALMDVGPPALAALKQTVAGPDDGLARRAAEVGDRIEVAEALSPTRVRLKLQDASIADAVAALTKQFGVHVDYSDPVQNARPTKKITLELDNMSFWEAIDRLCDVGDLTYQINFGQGVQLSQGPRTRKELFADVGPFRFQATSWNANRFVSLQGKEAPAVENLSLNMTISGASGGAVAIVGWPTVQEAEDDAGQSRLLVGPKGAGPVFAEPMSPLLASMRTVQLKPSDRRGGSLKRLKGVLPVEVMTDRRDLATAAELGKAQGKTFGGNGVRLSVQSVQGFGNGAMVTLSLDGGPPWAYDAASMSFELTDADGRRIRPTWVNLNPVGQVRRRPGSAVLAVLSGAPAAGFPGALPWAALAPNASRPEPVWTGSVQFVSPDNMDLSKAKLTFYHYRRLRTELPFEFHDLPLP